MQDKKPILLSTERSYQIEDVSMKDEEDPNQIVDASPVAIKSAEKTAKEEVGDKLETPLICVSNPNIRSKSKALSLPLCLSFLILS